MSGGSSSRGQRRTLLDETRSTIHVPLTEEEYNTQVEQGTINNQWERWMAYPNILNVRNPEGLTTAEI